LVRPQFQGHTHQLEALDFLLLASFNHHAHQCPLLNLHLVGLSMMKPLCIVRLHHIGSI